MTITLPLWLCVLLPVLFVVMEIVTIRTLWNLRFFIPRRKFHGTWVRMTAEQMFPLRTASREDV